MTPRTARAAPDGLAELLDHVLQARGLDFSGYKPATLQRRIAKRMEALGADGYERYQEALELDPDEFARLFATLLINVTSFFRDPEVWEHLRREVVPGIVAALPEGAPIRVWCAGCSTGEEPYTLAMVLAEVLGEEAYRERVKVYATDVDDEALARARLASFSAEEVDPVPRALLERCFERVDTGWAFRRELRRTVIFGRNDLVQDAPISRIDLLSCRNTLMYFNAETQARILRRFRFALNPHGALLLGRSEMLVAHGELFRPLDLKHRVYARADPEGRRGRPAVDADAAPSPVEPVSGEDGLRDSAFEVGAAAQVVVDAAGFLVAANRSARTLFRLADADLGRPFRDLELSYRPAELRSAAATALADRRVVELGTVAYSRGGDDELSQLEVQAAPLVHQGEARGVVLTFLDVTARTGLEAALVDARRDLGTAYEELQSTVEELETTNEELQSTVEELETTNEELQSSNEELETMNEELQSTNEELGAINEELRRRSGELDRANGVLEAIQTSMGVGVAVVDPDLRVQLWNGRAEDLWGLRGDEALGRGLLGLDIGLPVAELALPLREVLAGGAARLEVVLGATTRRGRSARCRVTCVPLAGEQGGAILLMELADEPGGDGVPAVRSRDGASRDGTG